MICAVQLLGSLLKRAVEIVEVSVGKGCSKKKKTKHSPLAAPLQRDKMVKPASQ